MDDGDARQGRIEVKGLCNQAQSQGFGKQPSRH